MNAFVKTDIYLPEKFQKFFHSYCLTRREGSQNRPEDSPFPRMVDMWFLSLCIAAKEGLTPITEVRGKKYKAIEGAVFSSDVWRSNVLVLLAINQSGDHGIVDRPHDMMRIVNGYALAGLPRLIGILNAREGDTALDYLSDYVSDLILGRGRW